MAKGIENLPVIIAILPGTLTLYGGSLDHTNT
jgi:hypothetical protein